VQGQQQFGVIAGYLAQVFGTPWFTDGWLHVKFVSTLQVFDPLEVSGVVTAIEPQDDGRIKIALDVWARRSSDRRLTTVGWASCVLPSDRDSIRYP
jgi:hypothetical protein